jgi:hypothetical protein
MNKIISAASATIANGASLSGAIDLGQSRAARIVMPAAWTAADLTVQTSYDGVTYNNLYNSDGTEYTIKAAASRSILLSLVDFIGIRFLKLRSGTSGTPVNQGADRVLTVLTVPQ